MASEQKTIVTHHSDGTQTTEVVDWTAEENAAHAAADAIAWKSQREQAYPPQVDKYIADCLAVKALYPKGEA